jgi:hypothetical protein
MHGHSYRSRFISITQARARRSGVKLFVSPSRIELIGLAGPIVQVCDVSDVERGEVLVDSHGEGSFQR